MPQRSPSRTGSAWSSARAVTADSQAPGGGTTAMAVRPSIHSSMATPPDRAEQRGHVLEAGSCEGLHHGDVVLGLVGVAEAAQEDEAFRSARDAERDTFGGVAHLSERLGVDHRFRREAQGGQQLSRLNQHARPSARGPSAGSAGSSACRGRRRPSRAIVVPQT